MAVLTENILRKTNLLQVANNLLAENSLTPNPPVNVNGFLLEDGSGVILLEDGSVLLLEVQ